MTRDEAHQLLDAVRAGTSRAPWHRIRLALQLTGDLPSAWSCPELRQLPKPQPEAAAA